MSQRDSGWIQLYAESNQEAVDLHVQASSATPGRVVVLERALAVGIGGIVSANVRMALSGIALHGYTVIAGLGGRPITKASLHRLFADAIADRLEPLTFLDLNTDLVEGELRRTRQARRSGPAAKTCCATSAPYSSGDPP
jgi:pyruvate ferredoxin oxidoreductase alpha subunit